MKTYLILLAILISQLCFAQDYDSAKLQSDSLKWESTNKSWGKEKYLKDEDYTKLLISKSDSTISLVANIRKDHRIFGFKSANKNSPKLILFSIWTYDVEGNPCKCKYGSYYQTPGIKDLDLKLLEQDKDFIKAGIYLKGKFVDILYFEKKWTDFEN